MTELLRAAKAVIEATNTGDRWCAIANLKSAVERAENPPTDAHAWYQQNWERYSDSSRALLCCEAWTAAQQAERERIKQIISESSYCWDYLVSKERLLEEIDGLDGI